MDGNIFWNEILGMSHLQAQTKSARRRSGPYPMLGGEGPSGGPLSSSKGGGAGALFWNLSNKLFKI